MADGSSSLGLQGLKLAKALVWLAYVVLLIAVVILAIAFFLRLFAANPAAEFTQWIYRSASRIMEPFRGIFPPIEGEHGSVVDLSLLFAMIMYGLLVLAVEWCAHWLDRRVRIESAAEAAGAALRAPASDAPRAPALPLYGSPPPPGIP